MCFVVLEQQLEVQTKKESLHNQVHNGQERRFSEALLEEEGMKVGEE